MKQLRNFGFLWLTMLVGTSCLDQFNPRPFWQQLDQEETFANAEPILLSETGELPFAFDDADAPAAEEVVDANQLFSSYCASCHGAQGRADGPASASLSPQPRNLADANWQASVDDEHIGAVIKGGGTAVGLSSAMPPWGGVLSAAQVDALVDHIRTFD